MNITEKIVRGRVYIRVRFGVKSGNFGELYGELFGELGSPHEREFSLSTGLKITDQNKNTIRPLINNYKNAVERAVVLIQYANKQITKENIKIYLNPPTDKIQEPDKKSFIHSYDSYIDYKSKKIKAQTLKGWKSLAHTLRKFEKYDRSVLKINTFSNKKFEQFLQYCHLVLEHHDNYLSKNSSRMKSFLVWAAPEKDWSFVRHKSYTPEVVYIYKEEFERLKTAKLPEGSYMSKVRDLFVFCCVTGMGYADSQVLNDSNLNQGLIEYRRIKTGSRAVTPLNNIALKIMQRWGGYPPKISNQKYNTYLKVLFRHLEFERPVKVFIKSFGKIYNMEYPLCDIIKSHMARKTFVMLLLNKKVPIQDIMDMSGHSDYQSIKPYINIHREHVKKYKNLFY